jgi:hypothetical protein
VSATVPVVDFFYDEMAFGITSGIERSIVRLNLESQAQFVSLINAIDVQLESGQPDPNVVRLLTQAFLALADARGVDRKSLKLDQRVDRLLERVGSATRASDPMALASRASLRGVVVAETDGGHDLARVRLGRGDGSGVHVQRHAHGMEEAQRETDSERRFASRSGERRSVECEEPHEDACDSSEKLAERRKDMNSIPDCQFLCQPGTL